MGQLVRGGLHEVDMLRRRMRCVYWPEHAHRISRGTWFVEKAPDWVPLKVCYLASDVAGLAPCWLPSQGCTQLHCQKRGQGCCAGCQSSPHACPH